MKPNNSPKRLFCFTFLFGGLFAFASPLNAQDLALNMPAAPGSAQWSPSQAWCLAALGAMFGLGGQLLRVVIGFKGEIEDGKKPPAQQPQAAPPPPPQPTPPRRWTEWFDPVQFWTSLALGAVAGMVAAFTLNGLAIDRAFVMGCATAGYAGSDFLEGLISKKNS